MSQPKKRPASSESTGDKGSSSEPEGDNDALESLPEILEVFGAAPLLGALGLRRDEDDEDDEPSATTPTHTDPQDDEEARDDGEMPRDASGRFVSSSAEDDALTEREDSTSDAEDEAVHAAKEAGTDAASSPRSTTPGSPPSAVSHDSLVLGGGIREIQIGRGAPSPTQEDVPAARPAGLSGAERKVAALVASEELAARLENSMQAGLVRMRELVGLSEQRLGKLEEVLQDLGKQQSFLPGKLRGLGSKLDSLASALGDERSKTLLESLVSVLDLVDGALGAFPPDGDEAVREPRRYFETIGTRLRQILEDNHIHEIPTDVAFDPSLHHALQQLPVGEPERHGGIVEVYRAGWRGEAGVLRYADVAVGRHDPAAVAPQVIPHARPKEDEHSGGPAEQADGRDDIPVHELDPSDLDEFVAPPGPPPRSVTDSSSITFRPAPPRNDRAR